MKIEKIIDPINADPKPSTENPLTNRLAKRNMMAFNTNVKSPNVTMVTGNVKRKRIGFTSKLSIAITMTASTAPQNPVIVTPLTIFETSIRDKEDMIRFAKVFIL